jgi:hypothetical protein
MKRAGFIAAGALLGRKGRPRQVLHFTANVLASICSTPKRNLISPVKPSGQLLPLPLHPHKPPQPSFTPVYPVQCQDCSVWGVHCTTHAELNAASGQPLLRRGSPTAPYRDDACVRKMQPAPSTRDGSQPCIHAAIALHAPLARCLDSLLFCCMWSPVHPCGGLTKHVGEHVGCMCGWDGGVGKESAHRPAQPVAP